MIQVVVTATQERGQPKVILYKGGNKELAHQEVYSHLAAISQRVTDEMRAISILMAQSKGQTY